MTPLTLKLLAGILQVHGPDATIASDNEGIDFLLASVRQSLDEQASQPGKLREQHAWYVRVLGPYKKLYIENYNRRYDRMQPPYDKMTYKQQQPTKPTYSRSSGTRTTR